MTSIEELWRQTRDVWQTGLLGYNLGDILIALGIFFAFYLLRGLFVRLLIWVTDRWISRTETKLDDYLRDALAEPLRFVFIVLGIFFAAQYLSFGGEVKTVSDNVTRSLIAYAMFWVFFNAIAPAGMLLHRFDAILTKEMIEWLITGLKWVIIAVGAATILQIWGIQVAPIIAGLGLFGVAVALGAQDLFKNLIGGLSILIEKRFRIGDWIKVDGIVEGTVEHIGFRSTRVRRFDKSPVYVPNNDLSDAAVTNFSQMTYRRIYWTIGVEYRTTAEQLRTIREGIADYLKSSDDFASYADVPQFVRIDSFGPSSIDILVYCFTKTTVWAEWLEAKERLAFKIKEIVEGAGTGFAFPSQSIYVESLPGPSAEPFVPPSNDQKTAKTGQA